MLHAGATALDPHSDQSWCNVITKRAQQAKCSYLSAWNTLGQCESLEMKLKYSMKQPWVGFLLQSRHLHWDPGLPVGCLVGVQERSPQVPSLLQLLPSRNRKGSSSIMQSRWVDSRLPWEAQVNRAACGSLGRGNPLLAECSCSERHWFLSLVWL